MFVAERGRIKDLDVRLPGTVAVPGIEHDFLGDVVIDLIGPDGTSVRLAEHPGGPDNFGKDFVNVTFDDEAALRLGAPDDAVTAQRPPYNGTFKPQNDQLSRFDGKSRRGTWTLRVRDLFEGDTGTLRAWGVTSRKAVCDFDSTPPDTTLVATPGNPTNETAPTFGFTSPDAGATFECSLDAAAYEPCTSPKSYSGMAGGSHTFRVRAIDGSGNEDPTPEVYTWTIDLTPPDTSIVSGPAQGSTTSSASANFGFSSEAQAHFECRIDLTSFTDCSDPQPQSYAGLAEACHTFQVRAIDLAHNTDPTPASRTWTVDTTAPSPTVTAPIGPTEDSEPDLHRDGGQRARRCGHGDREGLLGREPAPHTSRDRVGRQVVCRESDARARQLHGGGPAVRFGGQLAHELARRVLGCHRRGGADRDGYLTGERVEQRGYDAFVCGRRRDRAG